MTTSIDLSNNKIPLETKTRESGIELFRIISMILIIAHHYVVNSGILQVANANPTSLSSIFLFLFGGWGKTGINCFVLITGYFMCKSSISSKKFLKLLCEVEFYKIIIYLIFTLTGYQTFTFKGLILAILPLTTVGTNFTGCYLLFFLLIPFLNILIKNMNERQHILLLIVILTIYTVIGTLPLFSVTLNYVSWYMVLYFIASYVRMYPKNIFDNKKFWGIIALLMFIISATSIVLLTYIGASRGSDLKFYLVADSNKVLALLTGFSAFMFFKNLRFKCKFINTIAASCFGVLLIHANSSTMRQWLWQDVCKVPSMYGSNYMILHAFACVVIIFVACTIIDHLRIRFIEKPLMKKFDNQFCKIDSFIKGEKTKGEK